ncbi:hypothetical protein ACHAPQ_008046 [Fusarium lateritium]
MARNHDGQRRTSKRKPVEDHHESGDTPDGKRLRSSSRLRNTRSTPSYTMPTEENKIVEVPDSDDDFQPEPEDGLVACPVCQSRMKEWQVFKHLETCTGPTPKPRRTIASSSSSSYGQHRQQTSTAERLPAINYSMYKDQALRKKMSDLGISNQGPRPLLERRHKEWMTIWNSNCDAAQPRKHRELLHDLETWENTQGGAAPTTGRSARNAAIIKDKDFDGAAWAAKHDTSFKDLINHARKTRLEAKRKAEAAAKESKAEETATSTSQEPPRVDQLQPNHSTAEEAPNSSYRSPWEGQTRMDNSRELIAPDPTGSTFMELPSSTADLSADPSWYAAIPNGHPQATPQPQFAVPYDNNMDMNNQRLYSYRDVLPQDPALGQPWSQNTGSNS